MAVIKVSNVDRTRKVGLVANSFNIFKEKVSQKFNISEELIKKCTFQLAKDGVVVDDDEYFQTIEPQTIILVVLPGETHLVKTDFEILMNNIRECSKEYYTAGNHVKSFIEKDAKMILSQIMKNCEASTKHIPRQECSNDDWFKGMDVCINSKEKHMYKRAQDRIRGYFYKTKDDLCHSSQYRTDPFIRKQLDELIQYFKEQLKICEHFGYLFDRSSADSTHKIKIEYVKCDEVNNSKSVKLKMRMKNNSLKRFNKESKNSTKIRKISSNFKVYPPPIKSLCNSKGDFDCQGQWDTTTCLYSSHIINPYVSMENRIIFQTWNLDHQIERARTVIPSILYHAELIRKKKSFCKIHKDKQGVQLTRIIYFMELFTIYNLKLVHIVCHDKGSHQLISRGGALCEECSANEEELII